MNKQASILLNFISSSLCGSGGGLQEPATQSSHVQRLIHSLLARNLRTAEGFEYLGRQLAALIRRLYFARQIEEVEQVSQVMLALPLLKELKAIALHYQALCTWKRGNTDEALFSLQGIAEEATPLYKAQVLSSTGAVYLSEGEFDAALSHYFAAARAANDRDLLTFAASQKMIAVIHSIYGDHQHALADLERLFPIVRAIAKYCPAFYYEFLNSYAVELSEVGRLAEAQNICAVTLASPFAAAYPEFAQTRDELAAKRTAATPSTIAVPAALETVSLPQAQVEPQREPARARSTISLVLRRSYSLTRLRTPLTTPSVGIAVNRQITLDWLAESTLPRGPPVLL